MKISYVERFKNLNFATMLEELRAISNLCVEKLELHRETDKIFKNIPDFMEASKLFDVSFDQPSSQLEFLEPFWFSESEYSKIEVIRTVTAASSEIVLKPTG